MPAATSNWDVRESFRGLRTSPALVFICVLSLGLGVGVNLTLFSWLSAMFFDQPTIARPGEVVGIEPGNSNQFSYLNYRDLKDAAIFDSVFGYRRAELSLRRGETTQSVSGLAVSGNFFDGLGVRAQDGRVFTDAEASPERDARVAVASHAFWRRTLDSDRNASRTAEIAIQMALGASSAQVRRRVLASGLKLVLIGIGIGTVFALVATRPMAAMLAGLSPGDPSSFAGTAIALTVVGLVASYLPARRATRVDPMVALRQQ